MSSATREPPPYDIDGSAVCSRNAFWVYVRLCWGGTILFVIDSSFGLLETAAMLLLTGVLLLGFAFRGTP